MYNSSKGGFQTGVTSAYSPTSSFTQFGIIPASGIYLRFDVTGPTTTHPVDLRFVHSVANDSCNFVHVSTAFVDQTGDFTGITEKRAHSFSIQARQSTATTDYVGSVKVRWISLG